MAAIGNFVHLRTIPLHLRWRHPVSVTMPLALPGNPGSARPKSPMGPANQPSERDHPNGRLRQGPTERGHFGTKGSLQAPQRCTRGAKPRKCRDEFESRIISRRVSYNNDLAWRMECPPNFCSEAFQTLPKFLFLKSKIDAISFWTVPT